jgi:N-acetylglucosamine kinase-like BadF-type ATPase
VVGDESSLLATAIAGPSNPTRVGEAGAREALHQAIREACSAAGIEPRHVQRACIGAAGAGREAVASVVRKIVAEIIPNEIEVVGDMRIALAAAFGEGPGVIVIAGTGSIAYGRDAEGNTARAGGWGFAISDEGSAHWIGREAISAVLRAADEAGTDEPATDSAWPAQRLFRELKTAWGHDSLSQLARQANTSPDFAALFPAVLIAAEAGDAIAWRVLAQASSELAKLAQIVLQRLFHSSCSLAVPVAMAGGVFRHAAVMRELFYNQVHAANPNVVANPEVVDPVLGALQMARRAAS